MKPAAPKSEPEAAVKKDGKEAAVKKEDLQLIAAVNHLKGLPVTTAAAAK